MKKTLQVSSVVIKNFKKSNMKPIKLTLLVLLVIFTLIVFNTIVNIFSMQSSRIKASSAGKMISLTKTIRNNWMHPFIKLSIIEIYEESKPNIIRKFELKGIDMNMASSNVVGTANANEIDFSIDSTSIFSVKY